MKTQETTKKAKILKGVVTSDKMDKTIVVSVSRFVKHPKYQKYISTAKKFKVHDEENTAKIGDQVEISETKPLSKNKNFALVRVVKSKS